MAHSNSGLQPTLIAITIFMPCFAFIFVVLRLYSRIFIIKMVNFEDALIIVAMLMSIALTYADVMGTYAGFLGYHWADIPWEQYDAVASAKYQFAMTVLYNPILALVKNAMLLLYLRLEGGARDTMRRVIKVTLVVNTTMMLAIFFVAIFQCAPISKSWSVDPDSPGTCVHRGMYYSATAALTILTDIPVIIIPSWMMYGLRMSRSKKLVVVSVLSLGFIVTAVSIYRLYFVVSVYYGPPSSDPMYTAGGLSAVVETNMAIMSACASSLKSLVEHWFPARFRPTTNAVSLAGGLVTIGGSAWMSPTGHRATVVGGSPGQDAFELHTGPYNGRILNEEALKAFE